MINWGAILAKFMSMVMSWLNAGNLRNDLYRLQEHNEIMYVALDDIARIDKEGLAGKVAQNCLDLVDKKRLK